MARPKKRALEELTDRGHEGESEGSYVILELASGKPLKNKGWPRLQACIRNIVGAEKVEKAIFVGEGKLLVKTKSMTQTQRFLRAKFFDGEEVICKLDERKNSSKGTIYAVDLQELSEEEVVEGLREFGVIAAKQVKRRRGEREEGTPCFVLTFSKLKVPEEIRLDYVVYKVRPCLPRPLLCQRCGKYGHTWQRCVRPKVCLRCSQTAHEGACTLRCGNCESASHTFMFVEECQVYKNEQEIIKIRYEHDVTYKEARKIFQDRNPIVMSRPFSKVVANSAPSSSSQSAVQTPDMDCRLRALEEKFDKMISLMSKIIERQDQCQLKEASPASIPQDESEKKAECQGKQHMNVDVDVQQTRSDNLSKAEEGWTVVSRGRTSHRNTKRDSVSTSSGGESRQSTSRGASLQASQRLVVINLDELKEKEKKKNG